MEMYSMSMMWSKHDVPPFLRCLRCMLDQEDPSILGWTIDGLAFEIRDLTRMTQIVLPKYFRHRRYASFQRQLNYFGFSKWIRERGACCTYSNPLFVRDHPELIPFITRKQNTESLSVSSVSPSKPKRRSTKHPPLRTRKSRVRAAPAPSPPKTKYAGECMLPLPLSSSLDDQRPSGDLDSMTWIDELYEAVQDESPRSVGTASVFDDVVDIGDENEEFDFLLFPDHN